MKIVALIFWTLGTVLVTFSIHNAYLIPPKPVVAVQQTFQAKALEERVTALEEWAQRHGMKYK